MSGHDTISALSASRTMHICPYCNRPHGGVCPLVKSIEYYPNGQIKVVEFKVQAAAAAASASTSQKYFPDEMNRPLGTDGPGLYKGQLVYAVSYYWTIGSSIPQPCVIYVTNTPIGYPEMTRRIEELFIRSYPTNRPISDLDIKVTSITPHDQMVPISWFIIHEGSTGKLIRLMRAD